MRYKAECLRRDPGCKIKEEPHRWPATPPNGMGKRWIVRDSNGNAIGQGDVGNPNSAWRRAYYNLNKD